MTPNLRVLRRLVELRGRGLGYRRLAAIICEEFGVCVSYRTIERWLRKYSHFVSSDGEPVNRVSLQQVTGHNELSLEPVNNLDLDVIKKQYGRLGRTERAVLQVILSDPGLVWTAAMVHKRLKLLKYVVSRQAVYHAMKRLLKRGILAKVPSFVRSPKNGKSKVFKYEIVKGEVIRGGFRLVALEPSSFGVHNLRVPGLQVIADDVSVNLSSGLFVGEVMVGEAPITQLELNSDIPIPKEILHYLRDRIGWGFTVIYPKPKLGILRIEHRLWPKDLTLSLSSKDEIEARGKLITNILSNIITYEVTRLRSSSDRRGVLGSVPSVL